MSHASCDGTLARWHGRGGGHTVSVDVRADGQPADQPRARSGALVTRSDPSSAPNRSAIPWSPVP